MFCPGRRCSLAVLPLNYSTFVCCPCLASCVPFPFWGTPFPAPQSSSPRPFLELEEPHAGGFEYSVSRRLSLAPIVTAASVPVRVLLSSRLKNWQLQHAKMEEAEGLAMGSEGPSAPVVGE